MVRSQVRLRAMATGTNRRVLAPYTVVEQISVQSDRKTVLTVHTGTSAAGANLGSAMTAGENGLETVAKRTARKANGRDKPGHDVSESSFQKTGNKTEPHF
jgi:hypothetical protein